MYTCEFRFKYDNLAVERKSQGAQNRVHLANAPASNGIFHVIDRITLPQLPSITAFECGNEQARLKKFYTLQKINFFNNHFYLKKSISVTFEGGAIK